MHALRYNLLFFLAPLRVGSLGLELYVCVTPEIIEIYLPVSYLRDMAMGSKQQNDRGRGGGDLCLLLTKDPQVYFDCRPT